MIQRMNWSFHYHFYLMSCWFILLQSKQVFLFWLKISNCLIFIIIYLKLSCEYLSWYCNRRFNLLIWRIRKPIHVNRNILFCYKSRWFSLNKNSSRMFVPWLIHWFCFNLLPYLFLRNLYSFYWLNLLVRGIKLLFIKLIFFSLTVKYVKFCLFELILSRRGRWGSLIWKQVKIK